MKTRPSVSKRAKELARQQHRQDKLARSQRRKEERERAPVAPGDDPDLVGIVPGPQPPLDE